MCGGGERRYCLHRTSLPVAVVDSKCCRAPEVAEARCVNPFQRRSVASIATIMRSAFLAYLILVWSSRTCDLLIISSKSKIPYFTQRTYDKK